jgi:hypothetical protein
MSNFMKADYEEPKASTGDWLKFEDGDTHKIRLCCSFEDETTAIMGWEAWEAYTNDDGKASNRPVRRPYDAESLDELMSRDRDGKPKHFWCVTIWHETEKKPMLWSITQRTIQKALREFAESPEWGEVGDITTFAINVKRTGEGLDTKYSLMAIPPIGKVSNEIVSTIIEASIDCRELFARDGLGENPFGVNSAEDKTDGIPF